jgi:hypothetical protein
MEAVTSKVPERGSLALMADGDACLAGLALYRRARRRGCESSTGSSPVRATLRRTRPRESGNCDKTLKFLLPQASESRRGHHPVDPVLGLAERLHARGQLVLACVRLLHRITVREFTVVVVGSLRARPRGLSTNHYQLPQPNTTSRAVELSIWIAASGSDRSLSLIAIRSDE